MGALQALAGIAWLTGAAIYAVLCRRIPLKISLIGGIVMNGVGVLLYLHYDSATSAAVIEFSYNALYALGSLPLYDLAARATPKGRESLGFGLMIGVRNVALYAISDPVGSYLYGHYHVGFKQLVWINAGSTLAVLLFLPVLPAALLAARERTSPPSP
jgi:hypothetical protein